METERQVKVMLFDDLGKMVEEMRHIESDVDACRGRYIIDAKSYMGVATICSGVITMKIHSDNKAEIKKFNEICDKYVPKERTE